MFAVYYLILCTLTGYFIVRFFLQELLNLDGSASLTGGLVKLPRWFVVIPASFLTGTLVVTWCTYIVTYIFSVYTSVSEPLYYGNLITMGIFTVICVSLLLFKKDTIMELTELKPSIGTNRYEVLFALSTLIITALIMFYTFFIKDGKMHIGLTVFSDFSTHLSMIRSFSMSSNFPTEYTFFADGTVRYHFMFQFLAGNLEYLGMRLDWAFNLPSVLSYVSFVMLLHVFALFLTGKRSVGLLTCILFFFRSSFAFVTFLSEIASKTNSFRQFIRAIFRIDTFIGKTLNESWGLWNQNVFLNQRHFAFSLGILLIILIIMLPLFKSMLESLKSINENTENMTFSEKFKLNFRELFWNQDAWLVTDTFRPMVVGLMLGGISFWNGAVVFAALPILFILAFMSKSKFEYLVIAIITVFLSIMESRLFIGAVDSVVKPMLTIGFLAPKHTLMGIIAYYFELLGVMPIVVALGIFTLPKGIKWISLAFTMPLLMATVLQLTPDIAVNHKYVMISVMLLNIVAASFIIQMYENFSSKGSTAIAGVLIFFMTATGVIDMITILNANSLTNINGKRPFILDTKDKLTKWVVDNTASDEVFLTDTYAIHPFMLSGRKIFLGWQYFAWSAGYNTAKRDEIAKSLFNSRSKDELVKLASENNIAYILIDNGLRSSKAYKVNEELIKECFEIVYNDKESNTVIYKTKKEKE